MFVRYFVVSQRGSIGDYVSIPFGSVDAARTHASLMARNYQDCRFYISEGFEYCEMTPTWSMEPEFVQLDPH